MKINEVIQERKPDWQLSGVEKAQYLQKYARATGDKVSGKDAVDMLGKSDFGLDPEEVLQRQRAAGREVRQDDFEKRTKERRKEVDAKIEREKRIRKDKEKADADREMKKELRQRKADQRKLRTRKRASDKYDKDMGFRKDAAGRTLRDPRYYRSGKTSKGKIVGGDGSIAQGINRFVSDPGRTVADYYHDKIDSLKDFLNTRIER